ncbi:MAG: 30S ribosomal protein S2 [Nitrospinota bacterium]|nr:30S ribosomal protein S2 [Nitrospinota bacterium]
MKELSIQIMMEAGLHFGHQTKRWNPKMRKYIFGSRNGIYILDLQKSLKLANKAMAFARSLSAGGGTILMVGSKAQAKPIIKEQAMACGMPYVSERWLGGMLTNFDTIKKSVARLKQLREMSEDGSFKVLAKKEVIRLQKELGKLERNLGGLKDMQALPDAVFIVDTKKESIALSEAVKLGIPIIGLVDTNCDPDGISHIIPGNDDANRAIHLVASAVAEAIMDGQNEHDMKVKALTEERERTATETLKREKSRKEAAAAEQSVAVTPPVKKESAADTGAEKENQ